MFLQLIYFVKLFIDFPPAKARPSVKVSNKPLRFFFETLDAFCWFKSCNQNSWVISLQN